MKMKTHSPQMFSSLWANSQEKNLTLLVFVVKLKKEQQPCFLSQFPVIIIALGIVGYADDKNVLDSKSTTFHLRRPHVMLHNTNTCFQIGPVTRSPMSFGVITGDNNSQVSRCCMKFRNHEISELFWNFMHEISEWQFSKWQKVLVFYCFMNQWLLGWLFCWKVSQCSIFDRNFRKI